GVGVAGLEALALLGPVEQAPQGVAVQGQQQAAVIEAAAGWVAYAPEPRWRVELPAQPKALKQRHPKYDTDRLIYAVESKEPEASFFVSHYDIPSRELPLKKPADRFVEACDGALAQIPDGRLEKSAPLTLDGHPGMEFVLAKGQERAVLRTYLV